MPTATTTKPLDNVAFVRIPPLVQERWQTIRDVLYGVQQMRSGPYLPYLNKTDTTQANIDRNTAYAQRAVWYPATAFTLEGFLGLAFRNDPTNDIDKQAKLKPMLTNVDGAGVSLYQQSQVTLANVIAVGRHGLFVDWSVSLKQPVIKAYNAESIINWRHEVIDAQIVLSMVVLEEEIDVPAGDYAMMKTRQWREVFMEDGVCKVRIWVQPEGVAATDLSTLIVQPIVSVDGAEQESVVLRSQGKPLNFIPFTFIGSQNNDADIDPSPLYGLACINVAHYRNSADYEDSVFWCGQTQAYMTGLTDEWRNWLMAPTVVDASGNVMTLPAIYIGSRTPLLLPENATFGYAQAEPNSLVKEAMDQKELQMVASGARMISSTPGRQRTATEDENDREETTSMLAMCVANTNEAYQRAFWFAAQYCDLGETYDASESYQINQDFTALAADATILGGMVKAWQTGLVAMQDVRAYLRRVGLVPVERTDEELDASIESDGPIMGVMGINAVDAAGNPIVAPPPPPNKPKPPGAGAK